VVEWKYALAVLMVLSFLFFTGVFLIRPLKWLMRLITYVFAGTVIILLLNILLDRVGMHIALNPATILTAGILQVPGAVMLVLLNYFFA